MISYTRHITLLLVLCLSLSVSALELLSFNHSTKGKRVVVTTNSIDPYECTFFENGNIESVIVSKDERRDLWLLENIYYGVKVVKVEGSTIQFKIDGASDITITAKLKHVKDHCDVALSRNFQDVDTPFDSLTVNYFHRLKFPTLDTLVFENSKSKSEVSSISSDELENYLPFYEFSLGLALNIHSNIRPEDTRAFNKDRNVVEPLPVFLLRYGPFFLSKDGAGMVLIPTKHFVLLATFLLEGEPYKPTFTFERKQSVYFGPLAVIGPLRLVYYKDFRGISLGEVFKATLAPEFKLTHKLKIMPQLYYQHWDGKYGDYYFGIPENAVNDKVSFYKGSSAVNWGYSIRGTYKEKKNEYAIEVGHKFYGKEVYNSPIASRKNEFRLNLVYLRSIF